jgi:hypothetical protein
LSDTQFDAVVNACAPLAPADRIRFLEALAVALRDESVIGDGTVAKAIRCVLPTFFKAPIVGPEHHSTRRVVGPAIE